MSKINQIDPESYDLTKKYLSLYTLDKYKEATLVSYLQDIDKVHEQRFIDTYDNVTPDMFKNLRIEIYQMTKNQLKNKIRGILYNLRKDLG